MIRHLKNLNECCLYAGLSCGVAFLVRLNPTLFVPVLLVRLGILAYFSYVVFKIEGNKILGLMISISMLIGWIGGYLDFIELMRIYQLDEIITTVSTVIGLILFGLIIKIGYDKQNKKN